MKKLSWLGAASLMSAALFVGCQKSVVEESTSVSKNLKVAPKVNSTTACQNSIASWAASNETGITFTGGTTGATLEAEQNGNSLTKLILSRTDGFTKLKYRITFLSVDNSISKVLLYHDDPTAAGGSTTSRDLFKTKTGSLITNGTNCLTTGGGPNAVTTCDVLANTFPACWKKCDKIKIEILEMGGAGNPPTQTAYYYLRKLTAPAFNIIVNPNPGKVNQPITITASNPAGCANSTVNIQQFVNGQWVTVVGNVTNIANSASYTFTPTEPSTVAECKYQFRAIFTPGCDCDYDAANSDALCIEVLPDDCLESFTYSTTDNKTVVFTYTSPVDINGAVIKLTDPHITGYTANDGKSYTVNNPNNPTVLTWTGNITKCVPITFSITYTPDCSQNNAGFANVWTDFKVNDISKKNSATPNIKFNCN